MKKNGNLGRRTTGSCYRYSGEFAMNGFLKKQRPAKRLNKPFTTINRNRLWSKTRSFVSFAGNAAKDFFFFIFDKIRYNPLVPKIISWSCLTIFLLGSISIVLFAILSPEIPPKNLVSTINDVSSYYTNPDNSYSSSVVLLPSEEKEWVALSAFDDNANLTGAGSQEVDRLKDIEYSIRPGETLSEIAYSYNVSYELLAFYNDISNANRIRVGTVIIIPSLANMTTAAEQLAKRPPPKAEPAKVNIKNVKISFESRQSGDMNESGITVQFTILDPSPDKLQSFEWDFGDGKRGFRSNPTYEYTVPKTYVVKLTARDSAGTIYRSNSLYIDVPYPGSVMEYNRTKFVTLSSMDDYFVVTGTLTRVSNYSSIDAAPLDLSESDQFLTKIRFEQPGYYGLTITGSNNVDQYYSVFVSPIPTMHADMAEENYNWYRTQHNSGTPSNCGPASASMAIGWSVGKYFSVSSVRQAIGWQGNGGTSFEELLSVIRRQGVTGASIKPLRTVQDVKNVIDSGNIAVILFHTDGVKMAKSNPDRDLFGKYYNDSVGHYVVIKGYSLNGDYFVIHDPIPNDWGANSFRYADELSMVGRNRYYSSMEILRSLRRADMIIIPRVNKP